MQAKYIYMKITHDKYELPIYVADTIYELAAICGVNPANISHGVRRRETLGWRTKYVRVPLKEPEETT